MQWGAAAVPPAAAAAASGAEGATPAAPPPVAWVTAPPPPREIAPGLVFASTPRRAVAYLIDNFIVAVLSTLAAVVFLGALSSSSSLAGVLSGIAFAAIVFGYFVLSWRSAARATPGMRLLKLQVGNAFDGRTLTMDQAVRRWIALGYPLYVISLVPVIAGVASVVGFVLVLILLITTVASPTKQGLHDRFANSAVVEPTGLGSGWIVGCVVILILVFVVLPILSVISLVFIGGQVSTILSTVGSPAP